MQSIHTFAQICHKYTSFVFLSMTRIGADICGIVHDLLQIKSYKNLTQIKTNLITHYHFHPLKMQLEKIL